ncbi:POU domain, class 6, transcription factor 2-like isoform X2 [Cimex lectularius]|uniref:POU domain protein n=1 Tax=Cimex lectularius TaxID=79782 RepID=A0A8I6S2R8_CIMLE|nr:POU domain, class 6, transcription factor 2-like isoform X2 [Cimex lectularius]
MAEGESEAGEGMLAAAALHQGAVVKREDERLTDINQESEDECSSLESCGEGNMGVPESRGHSPQPNLEVKQQLNGLLNLSSIPGLQGLNLQQQNAGPSAPPQVQGVHTPGIINNQPINTPLNLSINATSFFLDNLNSANLLSSGQQVVSPPQPSAMPQLILASGQIIQGIQGAQLLIPTSQGIATQTILTIPINAVTNNQMVNMPMSNGQVMTTTLANLAHQYAHTNANSPTPANIGPTIPAPPLPHLLNGHSQHQQHLLNAFQQQQQQQQQQQTQPQPLLSQPQQQPQAQPPPQQQNQHQQPQPPLPQPSQKSPISHSPFNSGMQNCAKSPPINGGNGTGMSNGGCSTASNPSTSPLNTISRLAASNNDLTITTSSAIKYQHSPLPLDLMDESNQPMISESRGNTVDGINLDEIKEFAKAFKLRRLSLGLTQTQVGQALSITEGPAYSQSAICSALATQMYCAAQLASQQQSMFEKLDITPKSAQKIKPVLEQWMKEAEERYKSGQNHLTEFIGVEPSKKRKRRTSFTPQALELLNAHFERNTHPSGTEITTLAHQLGYEREVIRIWFCNKRQALKNTVRMMSKGCT